MFYLNKQRLNYYIILFVRPKYFHLKIYYEEFMHCVNDFLYCVKDIHWLGAKGSDHARVSCSVAISLYSTLQPASKSEEILGNVYTWLVLL